MKTIGFCVALAALVSCGSKDSATENAGQSCTVAADCFTQVKDPLKGGAAVCLTKVTGGYCTHTCQTDADCCAVAGECRTGFPQVCSPFESQNQKYCFLSCEDNVIKAAGAGTSDYCQTNASMAFSCRSSGGGSQNRKVCTP